MRKTDLSYLLKRMPDAYATINGSEGYPKILGNINFYKTPYGVMVITCVSGLPTSNEVCSNKIFAFHIHEGEECTGNEADPFSNTRMHYNPRNCPHPHHSGDMPPLFGANGYAFSAYLTNNFTIDEIIGKTVLIHERLDDFTTQPAGNAGAKIACGKINRG